MNDRIPGLPRKSTTMTIVSFPRIGIRRNRLRDRNSEREKETGEARQGVQELEDKITIPLTLINHTHLTALNFLYSLSTFPSSHKNSLSPSFLLCLVIPSSFIFTFLSSSYLFSFFPCPFYVFYIIFSSSLPRSLCFFPLSLSFISENVASNEPELERTEREEHR